MKSKIKAFRVPEAALKGDRMLSYEEICDGDTEMIPVTMRDARDQDYQVLEDVKGNVYIIKNKWAKNYKLDERPLGKVQSDYLKPKDYDNQQELPLEKQPEASPEEKEDLLQKITDFGQKYPTGNMAEDLAENSGEEVKAPSEKTMEKLAEIREKSEKITDENFGEKLIESAEQALEHAQKENTTKKPKKSGQKKKSTVKSKKKTTGEK